MGENGQVHHGDESPVSVNFSKSSLGYSPIDSLALADILLKLEDVTGTRIPAGKSNPRTWTWYGEVFHGARVGKARTSTPIEAKWLSMHAVAPVPTDSRLEMPTLLLSALCGQQCLPGI